MELIENLGTWEYVPPLLSLGPFTWGGNPMPQFTPVQDSSDVLTQRYGGDLNHVS